MSAKWQKKTLREVADFALGKMLDQKTNKGYPRKYLANIDVRWGSFDLANVKEMPFLDKELERYGLKYGDIVMCEGGEPGRCAIWKDQVPGMMYQKALHRIRPHEGLDSSFLYYYFLRLGKLDGFVGMTTGATIRHLPKEMLAKIEVPVPPLPVQKKIASILSAYDDLIENNRRRIAILEEMARKVYRKRFGGKKANGTIADLGAVCDTIGGGTPSTSISEYWEGGTIPWVVPTDVTRNASLILLDTDRKITQKGLQSSSSRMLPARSILMTSRASVGYFAIANFPVCTNQGFISIVPHDENMRYYLLHNLMERVEEIRSNAKGSTFPEISKTRFRSLKINVPSEGALNNFHLVVEPIYNQVQTLAEANRKLAAARDALLPKLMSGKLEAAV